MARRRNPRFDAWFLEQTRKGDPLHNPYLTEDAFEAGFAAGRRAAEREAAEEREGHAVEAMWKERQGEDYGSY